MKYRCRKLKPEQEPWSEVEAETPEEAANEYHSGEAYNNVFSVQLADEEIHFSLVEVEGFEPMLARFFAQRIRRGPLRTTIDQVAKELETTPEVLLEENWEGEEEGTWVELGVCNHS